MPDFANRFGKNLRTGGEGLEDADYVILNYQALVKYENGIWVGDATDKPQEALPSLLDTVQEKEQLSFDVSGDEFAEAIQEGQDVESLIYRNIEGLLHVEEPPEEPYPAATELEVRYIPEFPDDYWRVKTGEVRCGFKQEDAHKLVDSVSDALEDEGFEVEKGYID